jgi:hypothetical protein
MWCVRLRSSFSVSLVVLGVGLTASWLCLLGCGNLVNERTVNNPFGTGVVLVTDKAVLRDYSVVCDAEWSEPHASHLPNDGTKTWTRQPPKAIGLPNGTKAEILDRKFLRQGELVNPYSAGLYDMERDRAVEVVLLRVRGGLHVNLEGWMPNMYLRPTVVWP